DLARAPLPLPFGVSTRDADRLRAHLEAGMDGAPGQQAQGVLIASGGLLAGGTVWGLASQSSSADARLFGQVLGATGAGPAVVAYLGAGAFGILEGLVLMQFARSPLERAWDLYLADPSSPDASKKVELGAGPGLVGVSVNARW